MSTHSRFAFRWFIATIALMLGEVHFESIAFAQTDSISIKSPEMNEIVEPDSMFGSVTIEGVYSGDNLARNLVIKVAVREIDPNETVGSVSME